MTRDLYTYFRSSASYRVRIALHWKGRDVRHIPVHLTRDGGEQHQPGFTSVNPQALVPVLDMGGIRLTQSLAIIEYLEERYPERPLLPSTVLDRARVRELSLAIACDIHPINNLRVLKYWRRNWVATRTSRMPEFGTGSKRDSLRWRSRFPTCTRRREASSASAVSPRWPTAA
jgi:maleylacetoacetate isomerase